MDGVCFIKKGKRIKKISHNNNSNSKHNKRKQCNKFCCIAGCLSLNNEKILKFIIFIVFCLSHE